MRRKGFWGSSPMPNTKGKGSSFVFEPNAIVAFQSDHGIAFSNKKLKLMNNENEKPAEKPSAVYASNW